MQHLQKVFCYIYLICFYLDIKFKIQQFGTISKNTDPFQIPRIDIWNKDSIDDYNLKIEGKYNWYNNIHFLKKLIK